MKTWPRLLCLLFIWAIVFGWAINYSARRMREQREFCWAKHCPAPYEPVLVYGQCTCGLVPH